MSNVAGVKQNPKKPENAYIKFDDGTEAWCPSFEAASKLKIGEPIPDDWTQDVGDFGPRAMPPRPSKGKGAMPAAFRNTKEGFLLEQEGYARKDERMDRRTALMQAVEHAAHFETASETYLLSLADDLYAWLRKTSGSGVSLPSQSTPPSRPPGPEPTSRAQTDTAGRSAGTSQDRTQPLEGAASSAGQEAQGEGVTSPAGACDHAWSPLRPDGGALPAGMGRCTHCNVVKKGVL